MGSSATRVENTRAETERSVRPSQQTSTRDITRVAGSKRVSADTIAFGSTNEITDSGSGLGGFAAGDVIEVRGSADNDGEYIVQTAAAGTLTVVPNIVTESDGLTIELRRK